jgi:excisionase family DNA binding protein
LPGESALLYTPAQAAQRLRVRESWLRKKAAAREVPCTFLGEHLRFSPADLATIIAGSARPIVVIDYRPIQQRWSRPTHLGRSSRPPADGLAVVPPRSPARLARSATTGAGGWR